MPAGNSRSGVPAEMLQHLAHRAVADGVRAAGPRRGHPADRRVGAGVDREKQSLPLELFVEPVAGHAGLDRDVEILGADGEDAIEPR